MKKKIVLTILALFLASGAFASSVQIHPPWGQDGNMLYIRAFGRDRYVIVKARTSAAINAAIDALGAEGGEVYCPEGTYVISDQIEVDADDFTLSGAGDGTVFQRATIASYVIFSDDKTGLTLRNFKIDGKGSTLVNPFDEIFVDLPSLPGIARYQARIENLTFTDYDNKAIYLTGFNGSFTVSKCNFIVCTHTASTALRIDAGGGPVGVVEGCTFKDIAGKAIQVYTDAGGGATISGNLFYSTGDLASSAWTLEASGLNPDSHLIITNNLFERIKAPVYLNQSNNTIANNNFSPYDGYSLHLDTSNYNNIVSNTFDNYSVAANVYIKDSTDNIIKENRFITDAGFPVNYFLVLENADDGIITNNKFLTDFPSSVPAIACMSIDAASTGNVFANNGGCAQSIDSSTAGPFDVSGPLQAKFAYREVKTDNYVITTSDFGKTLVMNSANDKTFSLPSVGASEDGAMLHFSKAGAGKLTIDAADTDLVEDSGAGDGIYNLAGASRASLTLRYNDSDTTWYIIDGKGTWVTY